MKLALDAMGGDNAPQINIDGAKLALAEISTLEKLYLVGREDELRAACKEAGILDDARVEIVHAPEVVEMEDSGLDALRKKRNSSMSVAVDLVKFTMLADITKNKIFRLSILFWKPFRKCFLSLIPEKNW